MKIQFVLFALVVLSAASAVAQKSDPQKSASAAVAVEVKDVTPDEVEKLLKELKGVVVIDVRSAGEFSMGHLAGAQNINFFDPEFDKKVAVFAGRPVILHCAGGRRSTRAVEVLKSKAFPVIYHMKGGFNAWWDAGKEIVK